MFKDFRSYVNSNDERGDDSVDEEDDDDDDDARPRGQVLNNMSSRRFSCALSDLRRVLRVTSRLQELLLSARHRVLLAFCLTPSCERSLSLHFHFRAHSQMASEEF